MLKNRRDPRAREKVKEVLEDIVAFNMEYPVAYIRNSTLRRSYTGREESRLMSIDGLSVPDNWRPYAMQLLR
jgi:hypothetical protein